MSTQFWFCHFSDAQPIQRHIDKTRNNYNMLLTNHESDDGTKKSKHPECRRKRRNKIKQAAKETTNEHWEFATKLVRDGTHGDTANNKTSKYNRG